MPHGFRTCVGCREKDPSSSWREKHHAMLCVACNVDHDRIAERLFVASTSVASLAAKFESSLEMARLSQSALAGIESMIAAAGVR